MVTPPVDVLREVLRRVDAGLPLLGQTFNALAWAIEEGLIAEDRTALTDTGQRVLKMIGGK